MSDEIENADEEARSGVKEFKGWLYNWQQLPLSVTQPDYKPGATVLVGYDDDGNRIRTARVIRFTAKTVETTEGRWRLKR